MNKEKIIIGILSIILLAMSISYDYLLKKIENKEYVKYEDCEMSNFYMGGYMYGYGLLDMGYPVEELILNNQNIVKDIAPELLDVVESEEWLNHFKN